MAEYELQLVELPALEQLQALGWEYQDGKMLSPDESDERQSFRDVVLQSRLSQSIQRINPWIDDENLRKVVRDLVQVQTATLIEANESIWDMLTQYISVEQDMGSGRRGQTVKIIDFDNIENNEFLCVNQFKVSGPKQNIIPDIVLFVNGLPLAVIECKSPYITSPMEAGITQLLRYANRRRPEDNEGAERLFHYNQVMISSHRDGARVGTISSRENHYLEWKDPFPISAESLGEQPKSQELLIAGMFTRANFLDIIQNFIVFEVVEGRTVKKVARYQQFRAVHKTIMRLTDTGLSRKDRGGVIWHTQGSGKSLTMVFLTKKMRRDPILSGYKLVFLTDRVQLDRQLTATFLKTSSEIVYNAGSVKELQELLSRDSSDVITAMVQKFQEQSDQFEFPVLNESEKIVVLADEAHRTQYGTLGAALNVALPNAPKIAFTGTPLINSRKTNNEFGSYIDTYTIEQAVADGTTVQILYEGREAQTKVTGDSLDKLFEEYFADRSDEERDAIKKRFGTERAVLEAPQRIRWICLDILKHYREYIEPNGFKAMIVTPSREAAAVYKEIMDELEGPESAVIISGDHNDPERISQYTDETTQKRQLEEFQKPLGESKLSMLIVRDMLLTGFDAPICQVMYLDRKLLDHGLLQAIARVNRTATNKWCGYVVDYFGLSDYLSEALDVFSSEDISGALTDLKDELPKLQAAHSVAMRPFTQFDKDDLDSCIMSLQDETIRQEFQFNFKRFAKHMETVLPDRSALPYLPDLTFLGKIAIGARNLFRDAQLDVSSAGEKVRKLIEEHLHATGVDPKIPPINLFAGDFKEKLRERQNPKSQASEIEHAIKHHISVNIEEDPVYYEQLSERLERIIQQQQDKWEDLVQLLLDLRDNIENDRIQEAEGRGLSETENSFYNILMNAINEQAALAEISTDIDERVTELVRSLVLMIEEATAIVDFFDKQSEVNRVRRDIRRAVLDEPFGTTELVQHITDQFMQLAEVKFK